MICGLCLEKNKIFKNSKKYCVDCLILKRREWKRKYAAQHKEEIAIKRHIYDKTEKGKEKYRRYRKKIRKQGRIRYYSMPENKRKAAYYLSNAVRDKRLNRSMKCETCGGNETRIEGHHHKGYEPEFWLDVLWLCVPCHKEVHRGGGV